MEGFFLQRYIDSKKMHALILEKCVFFLQRCIMPRKNVCFCCKDALCLEKMHVFEILRVLGEKACQKFLSGTGSFLL